MKYFFKTVGHFIFYSIVTILLISSVVAPLLTGFVNSSFLTIYGALTLAIISKLFITGQRLDKRKGLVESFAGSLLGVLIIAHVSILVVSWFLGFSVIYGGIFGAEVDVYFASLIYEIYEVIKKVEFKLLFLSFGLLIIIYVVRSNYRELVKIKDLFSKVILGIVFTYHILYVGCSTMNNNNKFFLLYKPSLNYLNKQYDKNEKSLKELVAYKVLNEAIKNNFLPKDYLDNIDNAVNDALFSVKSPANLLIREFYYKQSKRIIGSPVNNSFIEKSIKPKILSRQALKNVELGSKLNSTNEIIGSINSSKKDIILHMLSSFSGMEVNLYHKIFVEGLIDAISSRVHLGSWPKDINNILSLELWVSIETSNFNKNNNILLNEMTPYHMEKEYKSHLNHYYRLERKYIFCLKQKIYCAKYHVANNISHIKEEELINYRLHEAGNIKKISSNRSWKRIFLRALI